MHTQTHIETRLHGYPPIDYTDTLPYVHTRPVPDTSTPLRTRKKHSFCSKPSFISASGTLPRVRACPSPALSYNYHPPLSHPWLDLETHTLMAMADQRSRSHSSKLTGTPDSHYRPSSSAPSTTKSDERVAVLAIAYYNIGVEQVW